MKLLIINGPNLNLLGRREPETYGTQSFNNYFFDLKNKYESIELSYFQSNIEGSIIDKLHEVGFSFDGIILNAGAYSHYSFAILDAIGAINTSVVEVHISNIHARKESFRHHSVISQKCVGVVAGFGLLSYELALLYFLNKK